MIGLHAQNGINSILVGRVVSDTVSFEEIRSPFKSDFLPSILKSTNKIEIRFFEKSREKANCVVLSFNEKWKVKHYQSKSNSWDEIEVM